MSETHNNRLIEAVSDAVNQYAFDEGIEESARVVIQFASGEVFDLFVNMETPEGSEHDYPVLELEAPEPLTD